jgi:hypothetical protein
LEAAQTKKTCCPEVAKQKNAKQAPAFNYKFRMGDGR